jgi:hypothetical protein
VGERVAVRAVQEARQDLAAARVGERAADPVRGVDWSAGLRQQYRNAVVQ